MKAAYASNTASGTDSCPAAASSLVDVIGNTPAVWLDRLTQKHGVQGRILAKLEYLSPGFSKKDRAARGIIEAAERDGSLQAGDTVVELTSGNMGTGLAIVCNLKGYKFVAVMSKGNSMERARMMKALGAEVVLVDQAHGSVPGAVSGVDLEEVEKRTKEIVQERGAFRADQFHHQGNMQAHYETTGPEIWEQSEMQLTAFVDFVGSGGTYAGVMKYLREQQSTIRGYVAEPANAAVLSKLSKKEVTDGGSHVIQGGGYSMSNLSFLKDIPFEAVEVKGQTATEVTRELASTEGIFAGFSAGANVSAALALLEGEHEGGVIGVVICDSGLKYLSTDLWE